MTKSRPTFCIFAACLILCAGCATITTSRSGTDENAGARNRPGAKEPRRKLRISCKSPWTLTGVIEELRSLGYPIPARLDEIQNEICRKLNFESFFRSGAFRERLNEACEIISAMDWLGGTPPGYQQPRKTLAQLKTSTPELPLWQTDAFLLDKVLAVGLK